MKTFKLTYFILGTGIFMLIFCILSGASIAAKYSEINGLYRTNKVSVNLLENKGLKGNGAFTRDDIRHLQEFSFKNIDMTYAAEDKALVAYENNQTQVNVFGISDKYNMFHEIKMKSGSFITSGNKNEMVAVVDEKLAIALFNNTNVVGLYIELYNQRFKIIGVVEPDESIIQALTDNGYGSIYIPVELKEVYDANSRITCLELRAADMGTTGKNINSMKDALGSIGKNASDYKIIDYNVERILVEESAWISIFIPGVIIMVLLLLSIKTKALELYNSINSTLKEQYFKDVLKLKVVKLSLILLEILVTLVFVYLIWKTIRFNIYIPPEYIPGDLIDRTFFSEVFERLIQKSMLNTGYVPTLWEMRLNILSVMQSWNLYIYIFAGLPLYYLGLKLLGLGKGDITKKILYCCIYMVFSIILSLLILSIFNMPITVDTGRMLIVLGFVFLSTYKKEDNVQESNQKV